MTMKRLPLLPAADVSELRARVDADPAWSTDAQLQAVLDAAQTIVAAELETDTDYSGHANVAEAVYQVAVKVWDLRTRGVQTLNMDGGTDPPAMPATAGLVRSVRGLLLPSMAAGGITV